MAAPPHQKKPVVTSSSNAPHPKVPVAAASSSKHERGLQRCNYNLLRKVKAKDVVWQETDVPHPEKPTQGVYQLNVSSVCELDHYVDPERGRRCLRGKHIVIIGDSLARFQYQNLVKYLESGDWIGRPPYNERVLKESYNVFYMVGTHFR